MRTEIVIFFIFIGALAMKFLQIEGSGLIFALDLTLLALIYFPFAFYFFSDKSLKRQNLALSIIGGLFLAIAPLGIMFKLMFWSGSGFMLMVSSFTAVIVLLITVYLMKGAAEDKVVYYKNMLLRSAVITFLSIVLLAIPSATLIQAQHWDDPELARLKIKAYSNSGTEEDRILLHEYMRKKDSIRTSGK